MKMRLSEYARPAAIVVGIASIVGFIALMLFFALEAPQVATNPQGFHFWGFLSDVSGPATMIPLILVMLALHEAERARAAMLSRVTLIIGMIGSLGVTILQVLLIIKVLDFEAQVGPVVLSMGIVGVWLFLANYMGWVQQILSAGLAWLGMAVGFVQALYPLLLLALGGADFYSRLGSNYVFMAIAGLVVLLSYIGFPVWAFWFARVWTSQRVKVNEGMVYAG